MSKHDWIHAYHIQVFHQCLIESQQRRQNQVVCTPILASSFNPCSPPPFNPSPKSPLEQDIFVWGTGLKQVERFLKFNKGNDIYVFSLTHTAVLVRGKLHSCSAVAHKSAFLIHTLPFARRCGTLIDIWKRQRLTTMDKSHHRDNSEQTFGWYFGTLLVYVAHWGKTWLRTRCLTKSGQTRPQSTFYLCNWFQCWFQSWWSPQDTHETSLHSHRGCSSYHNHIPHTKQKPLIEEEKKTLL